jgi:sec-independent protein translocase protein TatA
MFGLGFHELLIIGVIAVLLFGRKLPEVARSLGQSYREFRKGLNEFQSQLTVDTYSSYSSASSTRPTARSDEEFTDTTSAPKFDPPPADAVSSDQSGDNTK